MRKLLLSASLLLLAGCAEKQMNELSYSELQQVATRIIKTCNAAGATSGEAQKACFQQEALAEDARRRNSVARSAAAANAIAGAADIALILGSQPH